MKTALKRTQDEMVGWLKSPIFGDKTTSVCLTMDNEFDIPPWSARALAVIVKFWL